MTNAPFEPRVALASLSGESDAEWAKAGASYAGAAFLGGIAIDEPTREAARKMVDRDRTEFLPPDPVSFVDEQLTQLDSVPIRPGFNVRTTTLEPLEAVADICVDHDAILEINAHCRQAEICGVGAGETLLHETEKLCRQVSTASERGADVSVKVRTEIPGVDLQTLTTKLEGAGARYIHVDAMDSESVVADIARATDAVIIANNGVRDHETVFEYLDYGADAVSVGRPSDNPTVLSRVQSATRDWFGSRTQLRTEGNTEGGPTPRERR